MWHEVAAAAVGSYSTVRSSSSEASAMTLAAGSADDALLYGAARCVIRMIRAVNEDVLGIALVKYDDTCGISSTRLR